MDYILKPSLEDMAVTKIAIALWDQDDVILPTPKHLFPSLSDMEEWLKAEDKVLEKVQGLQLPELLTKKLMKFISGVGWEIFNWRKHLNPDCKLDIVLLSEIFWTPHGTVDRKKTAEALIQNETINVTSRYRLACRYCLEDDIPKLWDKIPDNLRERFHNAMELDFLVLFWTYRMNGELDKLDDEIERWGVRRSPYQYAFEYAASRGNKAATEYFLQRLAHGEKEVCLLISAKIAVEGGNPGSVFFFLLSQMDERNQREVFEAHAQNVLSCLLEWPWQTLFIETVNRVRDFLSETDFYNLLITLVIYKAQKGYRDCDYQKLFGEVWQQSPNAHKKCVIRGLKTLEPSLLSALLETEDIENVRLILKSATVEERKGIIFSTGGHLVCERLVDADKWDSVKLFLQDFLSSKEAMIEFKEEFKKGRVRKKSARPAKYAKKKYKWDKFFQLLDDLIQDNNNKRSAEGAGEITSDKRLRGTEFERM